MSAWVLVRGLTREARHWAHLPEPLRASGIEGEFVFADLPGTGAHVGLRAPANVEAMVEFVRADLASRGHAPPYSVIAMSLGAMVATAWAQREPREIERLALINTSMRPFSSPLQRLRPRAWPELLCAAARWRERREVEAAIHNLTCNRRDTRDADLAAWIAIYRGAPVTRANALRQLWAGARYRAGRAAPRCPTLIVSSSADTLVHPACSAHLAQAWGAAHVAHPWAGHDLPHDDAVWLAQAIAAWAGDAGAGQPVRGRSRCTQ
ncbi:MAG TPA: alpha/beta fold hydrolase [Trinickia sp.]|jgi:pimeloyl-ACP methyl ester carboxylesterase|nr:alpha/beta fold hydrolase [Trinickia sp.]